MSFFMCVLLQVCFLLGDNQEAKFGGVMSAQNIHHLPTFYHIFDLFHITISVVIAQYLILVFLCI